MNIKKHIFVIVHGKSEEIICKHIKSKLRVPCYVYRDTNTSIQVNSLMNVLNNKFFNSLHDFRRKFDYISYDPKSKKLKYFKLYIILDVDDCSDLEKQKFIDGTLFNNHWLKSYIIPIYNCPNLEATMNRAGYPVQHKIDDYLSFFSTNQGGDLDLKRVEELSNNLKQCPKNMTNMYIYIDECLEFAKLNLLST